VHGQWIRDVLESAYIDLRADREKMRWHER
jgi:hypothetical protein